jgi:pilus assembly protein CpaE
MNQAISLLITGRSKSDMELVEAILERHPEIKVVSRLISNGHVDPLHGLKALPDILVIVLGAQWEEELKSLKAYSPSARPRIIALGPDGDTKLLRAAMQAGARDFLSCPPPAEELVACIERIAQEITIDSGSVNGTVTAVINAKGGSGASFLACNLAHILAAHQKQRVALLDMDLQFGMLPVYLNMPAQDSLLAAVSKADHLDTVALQGHMMKHESGLHLLSSMSDYVPLPWEIPTDSVARLIDCAKDSYEHVVIDLPRLIDPITSLVLERADWILVMMQQSVTHLRDAKRLFHVMIKELLVPAEHLHLVINRYDKKSPVSVDDIKDTLKCNSVIYMPNDFARASQAINLGTPLYKIARNAPITRTIIEMAERFTPSADVAAKGRLRGALSQLFGG